MNKFKNGLVVAIVALAAVPAAAAACDKDKDMSKAHAAKACRAERDQLGVDAFRAKYGTAKSKHRNAFGKCVSQHAKHHGQGKSHGKSHEKPHPKKGDDSTQS